MYRVISIAPSFVFGDCVRADTLLGIVDEAMMRFTVAAQDDERFWLLACTSAVLQALATRNVSNEVVHKAMPNVWLTIGIYQVSSSIYSRAF